MWQRNLSSLIDIVIFQECGSSYIKQHDHPHSNPFLETILGLYRYLYV